MPLGLRFPNVLGGGAGGTHVPRAVLQLANEILEVADADWSRAIWITCAKEVGDFNTDLEQWLNARMSLLSLLSSHVLIGRSPHLLVERCPASPWNFS